MPATAAPTAAASSSAGCPTPRPTAWAVDGLAIPLAGGAAEAFHTSGGGAVYFFALLYCFMGVAVVSDPQAARWS